MLYYSPQYKSHYYCSFFTDRMHNFNIIVGFLSSLLLFYIRFTCSQPVSVKEQYRKNIARKKLLYCISRKPEYCSFIQKMFVVSGVGGGVEGTRPSNGLDRNLRSEPLSCTHRSHCKGLTKSSLSNEQLCITGGQLLWAGGLEGDLFVNSVYSVGQDYSEVHSVNTFPHSSVCILTSESDFLNQCSLFGKTQ